MIKTSTLDITKHTKIQFLYFSPKLNLVKTLYQKNPSTDSIIISTLVTQKRNEGNNYEK